jgi:uncharacterized protein (TIGR00299 family) protein
MRIAYLDCFSGISGDMFMGALLDAGVPSQVLEETVTALNIDARLEISRVNRSGISATKVDVYSHGEKDSPREQYQKARAEQKHSSDTKVSSRSPSHHPSESDHVHEHSHVHSHPHPHDNAHQQQRGLSEIREIIAQSKISQTAKRKAAAIFENLGKAEAKIHNVPVENVHFHEVGAVDALVDIVCAAVGAEWLQVDQWICSPLNLGGGTIECAHGTFPVPAPATLELLKEAAVYSSGPQAELVTPTGAAIAKTLAARFASFPKMKISATGYGAGTRDFPGYPNVLRLTLGDEQRAAAAGVSHENVTVLEASLDDLNPQVFGYVIDQALAEGALEAFGTPLQMKKNRPGMLLTVLARSEDAERLAKLIFAETTTLGVRIHEEQRRSLGRRWVNVPTQWGEVRMKVANLNGTITNYAPEYEDCRRIASEHHVPLKAVMQAAVRVYQERTANEQHG